MSNSASAGQEQNLIKSTLKLIGGHDTPCAPNNKPYPDLDVYGGARVRKTLRANDVCIEGNIAVDGSLDAPDPCLPIIGNVCISGWAEISDYLSLGGPVIALEPCLEVIGNICTENVTIGRSIIAPDPCLLIDGNLCISGYTLMRGPLIAPEPCLEIIGNLCTCGNIIVNGSLQLNGDINGGNINGGNINVDDINVKNCYTGNVIVGNIVVTGGQTINGDVTILGNLTGNLSVTVDKVGLDPRLLDGFGGQRVTNPYTLFDSKFLTNKKPEYWDEIVQGGGTSVFHSSYISLGVTGTNQRVVRQSRPYQPYQPGKGLRILCTGTLVTSLASNVVSRIGFFDNANDKNPALDTEASGNGYFFEWDGFVVNIVERSFITGSQVDNKVPQSLWNIDRFDGTGPSKIVLDITKRQIFMFELEWLGVGTVVAALLIDRTTYWAHLFHHANLVGQLPYISRPTLPVRYEISSTGGTAQLEQVCCTVISDGGYTPRGSIFSKSMGATTDVSVSGSHVALIGLRLKTTNKRAILNILKTTVLTTSGNNAYVGFYRFVAPLDPFSGTASWISAGSYSGAEYAIQNTLLTMTFSPAGGIVLDETYISNRGDVGGSDLADRFGAIVVSNIIGYSDIIVIAAGPNSGTKCAAAIQWQELE